MYRIIQSPASAKADSAVGGETGLLTSAFPAPVLCCPGLVTAALGAATGALVQAGVDGAEAQAAQTSDPGAGTECPDSALDFATSALYLPPSRLSAVGTRVSGNASVDELIHAVREDRVVA